MELNLRIREIRKEKGLTGKELAAMVGVSGTHISEVERGIKNVNNHLLVRIAAALEVKEQDLIGSGADDKWSELLRVLEGLDEDNQKKVAAFAENLRISQGS